MNHYKFSVAFLIFALWLPTALAEKQIFIRAGDMVLPDTGVIFNFGEAYDLDERRLCFAAYRDNGNNLVGLYDLSSATTTRLIEGTDSLKDTNDNFSIGFSCSMGLDYAVSSGLLNDFVTQAHVLQFVLPDGTPTGDPFDFVRSNDILSDGSAFVVAENAVADGITVGFSNSLAGVHTYNVLNLMFSTAVNAETLYPGTDNLITGYSQLSAVNPIGFQAFSLGGDDGVLFYDTTTGQLTEEVAYTNGGSQPQLFEVDGTARAMYSGFDPSFNVTLFTSIGGGTAFVTAGDPIVGGGTIGRIGFFHTASSAVFPGGDGFCGFYNATLEAEPFGDEYLMRSCQGPAPAAPETEIILSPGEVVDGVVIDSWLVAPEAADGRDVVVLVTDDTGSRALLFIGVPEVNDSDSDGVVDSSDNCTLAPNSGQQDTDGDGIGNACDADLSQDCRVNFADLAAFKASFPPAPFNPNADFDSDGRTNFGDLAFFKSAFSGTPGPSGVSNLCE